MLMVLPATDHSTRNFQEEAAMTYENIIFDVVEGIATIPSTAPKRSMR